MLTEDDGGDGGSICTSKDMQSSRQITSSIQTTTTTQSWTLIGFIHGLDWIGFGLILEKLEWIGLGPNYCRPLKS